MNGDYACGDVRTVGTAVQSRRPRHRRHSWPDAVRTASGQGKAQQSLCIGAFVRCAPCGWCGGVGAYARKSTLHSGAADQASCACMLQSCRVILHCARAYLKSHALIHSFAVTRAYVQDMLLSGLGGGLPLARGMCRCGWRGTWDQKWRMSSIGRPGRHAAIHSFDSLFCAAVPLPSAVQRSVPH